MITLSLRLTTSATTPVGISKRNTESSSTVPTSTICSGSSPATSTMNTRLTVIIADQLSA